MNADLVVYVRDYGLKMHAYKLNGVWVTYFISLVHLTLFYSKNNLVNHYEYAYSLLASFTIVMDECGVSCMVVIHRLNAFSTL